MKTFDAMTKPKSVGDAWLDALHQWYKGDKEAVIDIGCIYKDYRDISRDIRGRCERMSCEVTVNRCSPTTITIRKV